MFNSQSRSSRATTSRATTSRSAPQTPTNRFSGWALDDDVENTPLQNQEATNSGIPPMPPTPSRPQRHRSATVHHITPEPHHSPPTPHEAPVNPSVFTEDNIFPTNTWSPGNYDWTNTPIPDWGVPPTNDWSACWDSSITSPPVPRTRLSKEVNVESTAIPTLPVSPLKNTATTHVSTATPMEHPTSKPLFANDYYHGYLETRRYTHDSLGKIYYITIEDVFEYVTLGRGVSDSYLDELTNYVTANVPTDITRTREETTFHGRVYEREIPLYSWEQYGNVARYCLEWVLSNPEKVSR